MIRIAIVGHRYLGAANTIKFVAEQCATILKQAQAKHGDVVALSALAEGADTLFAEAALALGIPLEIVRPFDEFVADFPIGPARHRYETLRAAARNETQLAFRNRADEAYRAAMFWVVDHSDVLVAVWNTQPAVGVGGTGDAVRYARAIGRKVIYLNVVDLTVTFPP